MLDKSNDVFAKVAQAACTLSNTAISRAADRPEAVYFAIGACSGSLTTLAIAVGYVPDEERESPETFNFARRVNPDSILFAALLTTCALHPLKAEIVQNNMATSNECQFGPEVCLDAMNKFEALTGRKPDSFLDPGMVKAARAGEAQGNDMLAKLRASRAANNSKLN